MDRLSLSDEQFLNAMEHHFHAQYLPPFGDQAFFNSGLFHYIVHEAALHHEHLDLEMKKLRMRFGTEDHRIEMQVYSDPPAIGIELSTPSGGRRLKITDGEITVTPIPEED